jgi:hypothetical protein
MPMRGGSPPPPAKRKQMRSPGPPHDHGGGRSKKTSKGRSSGRAPVPFVMPLEIPSASRRTRDRRLVSPRAGNWDDLSDSDDKSREKRPPRRLRGQSERQPRRDGRGESRGSRSSGARQSCKTNNPTLTSRWATAVRQHPPTREAKFKEDDERGAEKLKHHRMEVNALIEDAMHASLAAHDAKVSGPRPHQSAVSTADGYRDDFLLSQFCLNESSSRV